MILVQRLRHISNETPRCAIVTKTIAGMLDDVQEHLHHGSKHKHDLHNGDFSFVNEVPPEPGSPGLPGNHIKEACESAAASKAANRWLNAVRRHSSMRDDSSGSSDDSDDELGLTSLGTEPHQNARGTKRHQSARIVTGFVASTSVIKKSISKVLGRGMSNHSNNKQSVSNAGGKRFISFVRNPFSQVNGVLPLAKGQANGGRLSGRTNSKLSIASSTHHWGADHGLDIKSLFKRFAREEHMSEGSSLVQDLKTAKAGVTAIKFLNSTTCEKGLSAKTWDIPRMPHVDQEAELLRMLIATSDQQDAALARTFNEVFLRLVRKEYWKLIEGGTFANPKDGELLLLSITLALSKTESDLCDFSYIQQYVTTGQFKSSEGKTEGASSRQSKRAPAAVQRLLSSIVFNCFMVFFIIASVAAVHVEEELRKTGEPVVSTQLFWLLLEIGFTVIFTLEFLLKFWNLRKLYFQDIFNLFDFVLIILGIAGICISAAVDEDSGAEAIGYSAQARMVRAARVFRALRLLRILRVFRFVDSVKDRLMSVKGVSSEVASHMRKVSLLRSFVSAHIAAQKEMVNIFCKDGQIAIPEVARCIVKSQTSSYLAITMAVRVEQSVDKKLMTEVRAVRESTDIAEHLEKFILEAHGNGVIGSREAAQFLHPLHSHLEKFYRRLRRTHKGLTQDKAQLSEVAARIASTGAESIRQRSAGIRASVFGGGGMHGSASCGASSGPASGWARDGEDSPRTLNIPGRSRISVLRNDGNKAAAMFGRVKSCPEAEPTFDAFAEESHSEDSGRDGDGARDRNGAASASSACSSQQLVLDGALAHSDEADFLEAKTAEECLALGKGREEAQIRVESYLSDPKQINGKALGSGMSLLERSEAEVRPSRPPSSQGRHSPPGPQSPRAQHGSSEDQGGVREVVDVPIKPPDQRWPAAMPPAEPPVSLNSPLDDCLD